MPAAYVHLTGDLVTIQLKGTTRLVVGGPLMSMSMTKAQAIELLGALYTVLGLTQPGTNDIEDTVPAHVIDVDGDVWLEVAPDRFSPVLVDGYYYEPDPDARTTLDTLIARRLMSEGT